MDIVLGGRHLELGDLRLRQLAALLEHLELAAGDGDRPLLRLGAPEHVPGAIQRAARLVAARAGVVEELPRAGARGDQRLLALEAALGEVQHRCRLPELGLPRAHVLLPGALAELDLLLLAADVGLRDVQLLVLGHQAGLDVGGVEPREHGVRRDLGTLGEDHRQHAPRHLAPDDALLALDEAGVVGGRAVAAHRPQRRRHHGQDEAGEREPSPHGHLVSATTSSSGSPSSSCSSARRVCAW